MLIQLLTNIYIYIKTESYKAKLLVYLIFKSNYYGVGDRNH